MHCMGIDVEKKHVAGVLDKDGKTIGNPHKFDNDVEGFTSLLKRFNELGIKSDDSIDAMEATGQYQMTTYVLSIDRGFKVAVVNPSPINACRKRFWNRSRNSGALSI